MPNSTEITENAAHYPTFGPPRSVARKPRVDTMLAEAVDTARQSLLEFYQDTEIGDHLGATADDERLVTHRFVSNTPGYYGWELYATLSRAPRAKVATVCETGMLPGENALLAPEWVPWRDRASEEERIRLDAIAAGEDPVKALEAAGLAPEPQVEEPAASEAEQATDADDSDAKQEAAKQARRDAKRRRAKQQAARRKKQKAKAKKSAAKND